MSDRVLRAAQELHANGIVPLPVKAGGKRPIGGDWQKRRPTAEDLPELFPVDEPVNIGVLLGKPSGNLIDVDCDCSEAVAAARALLGTASVQSARGEAEVSHYWFRASDRSPKTRRFTDPANPGSVLVELRSDGAQTVVPPSTHPDGTPYRWIKPITSGVDTVTADEAERIVRTIASVALLARHWPQKGSRHAAHLALCGALLRNPNGDGVNEEWRDQTAGFVRLVAGIGNDDEWWEREENVRTTIESLEAGHPVQGWTTLTKHLPASVIWQVREWLGLEPTEPLDPDEDLDFDEEEDLRTLDEEWSRVMLGDLLIDGVPEPVDLLAERAPGILYEGEVITLQSAGGSGKTLVAMWLLYQLCLEGHTVVFIDEENGPNEVARRFLSLGADPAVLNEKFIYYAMPSIDWMSPANPDRLLQVCEDNDVTLVLFDSVMDLLSASGLDENSNSEFNMLYKSTAKALKSAGRTVLLLDHVSKDSTFQARGASAKFDQASIVWGIKVMAKFDSRTPGHLQLRRRKGRLGAVQQSVDVFVTPSAGRTHINVAAPVEFHDRGKDLLETLMEMGAYGEANKVAKNVVAESMPGRKTDLMEYLSDEEGWYPDGVVKWSNDKGTRTYFWVEQ